MINVATLALGEGLWQGLGHLGLKKRENLMLSAEQKKKKTTPKPHTQKVKTAVGVGGGGGAGLQIETKALGCCGVAINLATFYKSPEI